MGPMNRPEGWVDDQGWVDAGGDAGDGWMDGAASDPQAGDEADAEAEASDVGE